MDIEEKIKFYQEMLTPTELLKKFPTCGLGVEDIGRLIRMGVCIGVPLHKKSGGCIVSVKYFERFLELREQLKKEFEDE